MYFDLFNKINFEKLHYKMIILLSIIMEYVDNGDLF